MPCSKLDSKWMQNTSSTKSISRSESKIGFENRDPGFELKTETGFQNLMKTGFLRA